MVVFSISNIDGVKPRTLTPSLLLSAYLTMPNPLSDMPVRLHKWHERAIASASSRVISLRWLNLMRSSRDVMTNGLFDTLKTVDPCDENAVETVESSPLMIVTTAITDVTPTITPTKVKNVRSLFARRLRSARRIDSLSKRIVARVLIRHDYKENAAISLCQLSFDLNSFHKEARCENKTTGTIIVGSHMYGK